jgi:hypothetical protein
MAQYKVMAGRIAGKKVGEIVSDADLKNANVSALIDGGHLAIVTNSKASKLDEPKQDEQNDSKDK